MTQEPAQRRMKLICCEVFFRETCHLLAQCPHQIDPEYLPKGLHDLGARPMRQRLQDVVDGIDASIYDAVLLGYGLCNNGLHHLEARSLPLVLPRAHDCITVFLSSRQRYNQSFQENPGTYYLTSGWIERGVAEGELRQFSIQETSGMNMTYAEMVEKYGEDNAEYLWEELCNYDRHYSRIGYIEMGVGPDGFFEQVARDRAREKGWSFCRMQGDLGMIRRLLHGEWNDEEFLVVPPRHRVVAKYDERIVHAEPV